jgi:putative flippase GtrA
MKKSDIIAVLVLGEIIAVFLGFVARGLELALPFSIGILYFALPILALIAVFIAHLIGKKIPIIFQFAKFITVGLANTAVDFGVLNFLMWTTGVYKGTTVFLLNSASFLVAVIHSYAWNKLWTFKSKEKADVPKQFLQFLIVSIIGLLINGGIVYIITTWLKPMFGLSDVSWANIGKIIATGASLIWNFVGYKFIVFKKKEGQQTNDGTGNLSQI